MSFCMVFATFGNVCLLFCIVFPTFGHVCFPFCMVVATCWHFNFSFAWHLLHFTISNVHVGFLKVSAGFHLEFSFAFHARVSLGFHLYSVSFRVSLGLRFH
jgi:hypothetical protein